MKTKVCYVSNSGINMGTVHDEIASRLYKVFQWEAGALIIGMNWAGKRVHTLYIYIFVTGKVKIISRTNE